MFDMLPPRSRRVLSSLGYTGLIALVVTLAYLTYQTGIEQRQHAESANENSARSTLPLVELEGYLPRREKSSDLQRLNVSVRLRLNAPGTLDCWVFVVARNDQVTPKVWAVWPPGATAAITAGGHFRGTNPTSGQPVTLSSTATRINASINQPSGEPAFETVMIYVVNEAGEIIVARPYTATT